MSPGCSSGSSSSSSPSPSCAPTTASAAVASPPSKGSAAAGADGKKGKKGKGAGGASPEGAAAATNGAGGGSPAEAGGAFGGGEGGSMPGAMSVWCASQMAQLTGNDDTTLPEFLYSLQTDDEVHSYLTMYLGASTAVDAFAKEFTLRKRAARGTGESREWQTCAPRPAPPRAAAPPRRWL